MKHFVFICSISFKPLLLLFILGASSDFDGATKIAKMMVTRFGMSDKVKFEFMWLMSEHFRPFNKHRRQFFTERCLAYSYKCTLLLCLRLFHYNQMLQ